MGGSKEWRDQLARGAGTRVAYAGITDMGWGKCWRQGEGPKEAEGMRQVVGGTGSRRQSARWERQG